MAGRYAIVQEPEPLEVADEDVYHPDQSVSGESQSVRSLDPIIAGPIGLKTVFYDPRWSENQRKLCLGCLILISFFCLALLIALFVGLGRVLHYINQQEELKKKGLHLYPDYAKDLDADEFYFPPSTLKGDYVGSLTKAINGLESAANNHAPPLITICNKHSTQGTCKQDINQLLKDANCKKEDDYGYSGTSPCLMFTFRGVTKADGHWQIKGEGDKNYLPFECKINPHYSGWGRSNSDDKFSYFPPEGFDTRLMADTLPSPVVFVRLNNFTDNFGDSTIKCRMNKELVPNLNDFKGLTSLEFNVRRNGDGFVDL